MNPKTGAVRPITDGSDPVNSMAVGPAGSVYVGQTDRNVYLIDPKTLAREWVTTTAQLPERMMIEGKRKPWRLDAARDLRTLTNVL